MQYAEFQILCSDISLGIDVSGWKLGYRKSLGCVTDLGLLHQPQSPKCQVETCSLGIVPPFFTAQSKQIHSGYSIKSLLGADSLTLSPYTNWHPLVKYEYWRLSNRHRKRYASTLSDIISGKNNAACSKDYILLSIRLFSLKFYKFSARGEWYL